MQVSLALVVAFSLLLGPVNGQVLNQKETGFCSSRTPEALHSPKCKWAFVVEDPHRVEDVRIPHDPIYHTYSRWVLDDSTYVLAYRDIDQQPEDMIVDIYYLTTGGQFKRIGNIRIPGLVTSVSTAKLTGSALPDLVFHLDSGELKWLDVVRFSDQTAKQVFWYGASEIQVTARPKPMIVAKSRIANVVEEFAWDPQSKKFQKIEQHPLRTAQ